MTFLINWLVATLAIVITAYLIPGTIITSLFAALVAALILGLINATLKPLLLILTLPINILTLGLFTFVINAALIMLTDYFVPGFDVGGFGRALLFAIVLSIINFAFSVFQAATIMKYHKVQVYFDRIAHWYFRIDVFDVPALFWGVIIGSSVRGYFSASLFIGFLPTSAKLLKYAKESWLVL